jgi:hypothetical protein
MSPRNLGSSEGTPPMYVGVTVVAAAPAGAHGCVAARLACQAKVGRGAGLIRLRLAGDEI